MNTKEKIEIMQAYLDGKTIQCSYRNVDAWGDITQEPGWAFENFDYRIKPKQKVKKTIKYLCFETSCGYLVFIKEDSEENKILLKNKKYTRTPEFDKTREIEVEE